MASSSSAAEVAAPPFAVIARFELKDGARAEWLGIVEDVVDAMRHEASFISCSLCADSADANRFVLFEVWRDRDDFWSVQAHRDYRATLMSRLPDLVASPVMFEELSEIRADYALHVRH